jgi:hypothetical protein
MPKGEEYPKYHFLQSSDSKQILIISFYSKKRKSVIDGTDTKIERNSSIPENEFQYKIIDFDLNEIANGIISTDGVARDFILTPNEHIFFISSIPKDKDSYFDYSIWDHDVKTEMNKKITPEEIKKDISSIQMKVNEGGTFILGFYNKGNGSKGVFCIKLKSDNTVEKTVFHDIENLQDESSNPNGITNPLPTIKDIAFNKNGDILLIGECTNTYLYTTYRYSFMGEKTSTAYSPQSHAQIFFGNIFVTCIDQNFNYKWTNVFNKSQKLNYDAGYSSFGYLNTADQFYCFYNEITTPVNIMMPPASKGITIGSVSPQGEKSEKVIGAADQEKMLIKAASFYQNGESYFAMGKKGKDWVLFKISE